MNKMYKTKQTVQTNKVMKASFVRYLMILALLFGAGSAAWAQAVIMNGNYYLTHNEAGTTVNTAAQDARQDSRQHLWRRQPR